MRHLWTLIAMTVLTVTLSAGDAQAGSVDWSQYIDHSAPTRPATAKQSTAQPAKASRAKRVAVTKAKPKAGKVKARAKRSRR
jgi:hypothetical protein